MEYVGIFLILVAAGLRLVGQHLSKPGSRPRTTATILGVHAVPPGVAAFLMAAAGVFIVVTSIGSR
ncbi:hypothetical protein WBN73_13875 [Paenarthrobacter sp. CCNWLY172]|uniref:hypothetical protein n=1 Tax=unclassified Paenarthrobacter TaxID=2634190 RepID=UPI003077637E